MNQAQVTILIIYLAIYALQNWRKINLLKDIREELKKENENMRKRRMRNGTR